MNLRVVFVALLLAAPAGAQSLWGEARYGMSIADIQKLYPHASAPADPANLQDGAMERLRIDDFELVHHRFRVEFFFMGDELSQVTLSFDQDEPTPTIVQLVFESLREALRSKYGPEISRRGTPGFSEQATWMAGETNINLLRMGIGDVHVLNVNYQVRVRAEADKL